MGSGNCGRALFLGGNGKVFLESQIIFQGGLPGRVPFHGIIPGMARYPWNPKLLFQGVYQVGALSWDHPGNGELSLES